MKLKEVEQELQAKLCKIQKKKKNQLCTKTLNKAPSLKWVKLFKKKSFTGQDHTFHSILKLKKSYKSMHNPHHLQARKEREDGRNEV